jgi:hypothetical protein
VIAGKARFLHEPGAMTAPYAFFVPPGIGHNRGPPLDPAAEWRSFCWRKACAHAWKTPPREIVAARLARARALGMSYREYTAVLLDRGVHL